MNSENIFAMLSFPLNYQVHYGYDTIILQRLYFILNAILYLNKYHFIVLDDEHPELQRNQMLHQLQFSNQSIVPFLVSFIPGQSSIPTDGNIRGDKVNIENFREYYRLLEEKLSDDEFTEPAAKMSKIQTGSDSRSPDRRSSARRSSDSRSPDRSSPDRSSPDRSSPDRSSPDRSSPDRISRDCSGLADRSTANRNVDEYSSVTHQFESIVFAGESAVLHRGAGSSESKSEADIEVMEGSIDREEVDQLRRDFEETMAQNAELKRELTESKAENKELKGELAESKAENRELKGELAESKAENKELKGELAESKAENKELKGELAESKAESKELKGELAESKVESKELKGELTESKAEYKELKGELAESKAESKELKRELTESKGESKELKRELAESKAESKELKDKLAESKAEKTELQHELRVRKIREAIKDGIIKYQEKGVYSKSEGVPEGIMGKPNYGANFMSNKQGVCFYNAAMEILYSLFSTDGFDKFVKAFENVSKVMGVDDYVRTQMGLQLGGFSEGYAYCIELVGYMKAIHQLRMDGSMHEADQAYVDDIKNKTIALLNGCSKIGSLSKFIEVPGQRRDGNAPSNIKDLIIEYQSLTEFIEALLNQLNEFLNLYGVGQDYSIPLYFDSYDVKSGLGEDLWLRNCTVGNRKGLVFNLEVDFRDVGKRLSLQSMFYKYILTEVDAKVQRWNTQNTTKMYKRFFDAENWDSCNDESYNDILTFTTRYPVLRQDQKILLLNLHYAGNISFSDSDIASDFIKNTDKNVLKVVFYCEKRDGFFMRRYRFDTMVFYTDPVGNRCGHYLTAKYSPIGSVDSWRVLDDLSSSSKSDFFYSWRNFALEREAIPEVILCVSDGCDEKVDGLEEEVYRHKI